MNRYEQTLGLLPDWGPDCVTGLLDTLDSAERPFPCTFGVAAARRGGLRFGFVEDSEDERTWWPLLDILTEYLKIYQEISRDTSLVVFFGHGERAAEMREYRARFWRILQFLHDHDEQPWPRDIPRDADHTQWEFSFGGEPMFVVCNTPAHAARRSRHSEGFLITFQPRWVFEGLAPDSPRGQAARRTIRTRLAAYDAVPASPDLGDYGDPANREWRQYFLADHNDDEQAEVGQADTGLAEEELGGRQPARCPFRHRPE